MLTCWIAIVAFREHHMFNGIKHLVIPVFGLLANLACMLFYLVGPIPGIGVAGMSWMEPYIGPALRRPVGRIRLVLLRVLQQEEGQGNPAHFPAVPHPRLAPRRKGGVHIRQLRTLPLGAG